MYDQDLMRATFSIHLGPLEENNQSPSDPPPISPCTSPKLLMHLLNLTGWRDDPENHIMYISRAVARHLHVGDS